MEHERPKIGIGVLVIRDGKVLLGKRRKGHATGTWMAPGGHLEYGESFEQTALRELEEETGLTDVEVTGLVSLSNDVAYDRHYVTINVVVAWRSGEPEEKEPEKVGDWTWFTPDALPENVSMYSKKSIENWRAGTFYSD